MFRKVLFITTIFSLFLAACSPTASRSYDQTANQPVVKEEYMYALEAPAPAGDGQTMASTGYGGTVPEAKRIVITDGNLSIAVADPEATAERIKQMAKDMGGFVVAVQMSQQTLENGAVVPLVYITVRVPAERLDEAIKQIKTETDQPIISENLNSQDVTSTYTDLQSRLTNLEAAEEQLQLIMDEAKKTEDVLSVYNQLVSVREQIEVLKGQIKYYDEASALSSLAVTLQANEAVQPISIGGWKPGAIVKDAFQALINILKGLVNIGIRLVVTVLPTVICIFGPFALIGWGIYALWKRRKKAKTAPAAPPTNAG
jgi:hypothetical protein